jgi:hypothetical protein
MDEVERGTPNAAKIVEHCREILRAGMILPKTALDALRQIEDALRREHMFSEKDLEPVTRLIAELAVAPSGRGAEEPRRAL